MIHLFLAHFVADHGFTDNTKIRSYTGYKLIEHIVWSLFALLAFTFDTLLKTERGIIVLSILAIVHILGDILRTKIRDLKKIHILELTELAIALILNYLVADLFVYSYISKEFAIYLLGMAVVSMAVTYIFRNFYPGDLRYNDLDGISERLAFFVFFLAKNYVFAFLSLALGFLYRLWKVKKFSYTWLISPLLGVAITVIWKLWIY
ncbi:MAG: hypothetical protein ACP5KD_06295 [Fervidobacterium sp.]